MAVYNSVISRDEKYFQNAESYLPERWIDKDQRKLIHPFASLPFGHGARACPGKRLAYQEMLILLSTVSIIIVFGSNF